MPKKISNLIIEFDDVAIDTDFFPPKQTDIIFDLNMQYAHYFNRKKVK